VYLDKDSWSLIMSLTSHVNGFLMVLATRPINKSYMAAFATAVPEVTLDSTRGRHDGYSAFERD